MTIIDALKMNCRQATLLSEKKKEGKITAMEKFGLWWHTVVVCKFCRLFFKQTDLIGDAIGKTSVAGDTRLGQEAKERMQAKVNKFFRD